MELRLRPVLDCRMPTLASKAAFYLPLDEMPTFRKKIHGLKLLESHPPRSVKDLRNIISSEIKAVSKKLSRLERSYYGIGKSIQHEVDKYVMPLKGVMRMLTIFEFSSVSTIENAIKTGSDPKRYKGDPNNIALLKEVFAKVQTYVPDKFNEISSYCLKILETLEKYFLSFYEPHKEHYLETAAHYEEQRNNWISTIKNSLNRVKKLQKDFKERMIHYTMFTPPVAAFCQKNECEQVPFLLLFADACTNIRAAMTVMNTWLQADENYPIFLRNDIDNMEQLKEEKIKLMRAAKTKYHSATYKLTQTEVEYDKAIFEVESVKEKEEALTIEADYLRNLQNELRMELEIKEFRKDELKKKQSEFTPENYYEVFDMLTEEARFVKERMPLIKRQLAAAEHKLEWMHEKKVHLQKIEKEISQLKKEMEETSNEREIREVEYKRVEKGLEVARKIYMFKTSSDYAEKIYFSLPIGPRCKIQPYVDGPDDKLDQACAKLSQIIQQDWMLLYRNLPFYPKRGSQTIEKDIAETREEGSRGLTEDCARIALARWRRHHTRAKTDDLVDALKKIKRLDGVKAVDNIVNPPQVEHVTQEIYIPPSIGPELVPFYKECERYDQLRASHKVRTER